MSEDITAVDPMDSAKKNSEVLESLNGEQTVVLGEEPKCYWNDVAFTDGSRVEDDGVTYECHMGFWLKR